MTDQQPGPDLPAAEPIPEAALSSPRRRGSGRALLWLLLLGALAAAGYWAWQEWQSMQAGRIAADAWRVEAGRLQTESSALRDQIATLTSELGQVRERQRSIELRLSDLAGSNKIVRDELLGVSERSAALEDALARLAQSRREGAGSLQLDEIEYLLQLAAERLQLFGDVEAAERTLQLASSSLDSLDNPLYVGLRQTLAQELALLRAHPADLRPALHGELAALQQQISTLPAAGSLAEDRETEPTSRLRELFGSLVTVRRIDDAGVALSPLEHAARRSALELQLSLAQAALERGDGDAWALALDGALRLFDRLFEREVSAVQNTRRRLQALHGSDIGVVEFELGAALQELRNLRATRRIGRLPSAIDTPPPPEPIELERP